MGILLLLLYAVIRRSEEVKMVSFGALVLIAVMTIAVFFTGQAAENMVEKDLPGVTETDIGRHEEAGRPVTRLVLRPSGTLALVRSDFLPSPCYYPEVVLIAVLVLSIISTVVVRVSPPISAGRSGIRRFGVLEYESSCLSTQRSEVQILEYDVHMVMDHCNYPEVVLWRKLMKGGELSSNIIAAVKAETSQAREARDSRRAGARARGR